MTFQEWCPNCGKGVNKLNDYTGWCDSCSSQDPYVSIEAFLEKYANHLEHYISRGFTVSQSVYFMRGDFRPSCLICGKDIPHAPRNAVFCSRHSLCRSASNRYRYLVKKGMSRSTALGKVMEEFN